MCAAQVLHIDNYLLPTMVRQTYFLAPTETLSSFLDFLSGMHPHKFITPFPEAIYPVSSGDGYLAAGGTVGMKLWSMPAFTFIPIMSKSATATCRSQ